MYQSIMEDYQGVATYAYPYAYAYQYTDAFYDAPLYNSQLKYYDDLVPLVQIVLHGSMDLYGPYLNYNSLGQEQILSLIDFGVYPSFILTKEASSTLKDTDVAFLFSTEYGLWKGSVVDTYQYVNDALRHVDDAYITGRTVIERGIVQVTYSNDVTIYINYTSSPYTDGSITVPALDYYVGGGSQ